MKHSVEDKRQEHGSTGSGSQEYLTTMSTGSTVAATSTLPLIEGASTRAQVYQEVALRQRLKRMEDQLQAVFEIGHTLSSTQDPEEILSLLLDKITELLEAERSSLFLVDYDSGEVWSKLLQGEGKNATIRLPVGKGIVGWVAQTGETVNIRDAYNDERFNSDFDKKNGFRTHNLLTMPLCNQQGNIIGVIQVLNKRDKLPFTSEDEHILQTLSSQAAIFLENARLYQALWKKHVELMQTTRQLKHRGRELDVVFDIEQQMSHAFNLDDALCNIIKRIVVLLGCEAATLAIDAGGRSRIFLYSSAPEDDGKVAIVPARLNAGEGFLGCALESGEALLVNRPDQDDRFSKDLAARLEFPVRSVLCVPIRQEETIQGAIELLNKQSPQGFVEDDLRLMQLIAAQISRAIEIGSQRDKQVRENRLATIGQLLSGVLHDFKSPMTIISGYAQMISQATDPVKRKKYSNAILKQIEQLNQMTREVLAFARGDSTLLVRKVSWVQFLQEVEQHLLQEFNDGSIHLHIENTYKGNMHFDEIKIQRMISNLARNAGQAMKSGGTFELQAEQDGDFLSLTFRDTGGGIPPEIQATLFDTFVSSKSSEGSGLGLAIVRKIVDDHGGNINFTSTPGVGTTFHVKLPIQGPPSPEE
ncbi:MAG: GAF domain-containing sensor histidine kinase [Deltaproteobacteria bacterium]|nr:MAG: GAF domain-containing sensor histidine kinase [Deltaproteobacteria bacterium]